MHDEASKKSSFRKILDGIQKMSIKKAEDEEQALRSSKNVITTLK